MWNDGVRVQEFGNGSGVIILKNIKAFLFIYYLCHFIAIVIILLQKVEIESVEIFSSLSLFLLFTVSGAAIHFFFIVPQ